MCGPPVLANPGRFTDNSGNQLLIIAWGDFMTRGFPVGLMLATALSLSVWSSAGRAYTPEQEQACTGDAFRPCSSEIRNVERVTACMTAKRSQLSPQCRAQFRGPDPREAASGRAGRPMAIRPTGHRKSAKVRKPAHRKPAKPART